MISVCMATYNGGKYIKEQIDSILSQLGEKDELVISDDGSTDDTITIIESYNDNRIQLLYHHNELKEQMSNMQKVASNVQNALLNSRGDYIFLSDQDDIWMPNKISVCMNYLREYSLVNHDCSVVDNDLNILNRSYFSIVKAKDGFINNFVKFRYLGCCMAFRRSVLKYILPLDNQIAHDAWICYINSIFGTNVCIPQQLLLYRRHGTNVSNASQKSNNTLIYKIQYRIPYLYRIIKRACKIVFKRYV